MLVAILRQCDVTVEGVGVRALFPGQNYDLPAENAAALIESGVAESREQRISLPSPAPRRKTK